MQVARRELALECDYIHEAENMDRMRALLWDDHEFYVPEVFNKHTTRSITAKLCAAAVVLLSKINGSIEVRSCQFVEDRVKSEPRVKMHADGRCRIHSSLLRSNKNVHATVLLLEDKCSAPL